MRYFSVDLAAGPRGSLSLDSPDSSLGARQGTQGHRNTGTHPFPRSSFPFPPLSSGRGGIRYELRPRTKIKGVWIGVGNKRNRSIACPCPRGSAWTAREGEGGGEGARFGYFKVVSCMWHLFALYEPSNYNKKNLRGCCVVCAATTMLLYAYGCLSVCESVCMHISRDEWMDGRMDPY